MHKLGNISHNSLPEHRGLANMEIPGLANMDGQRLTHIHSQTLTPSIPGDIIVYFFMFL